MEYTIEVNAATNEHEYTVKVLDQSGSGPAVYTVTVTPEQLATYGVEGVPVGTVLRHAFMFLLERENPSQILSRFTLADIERYFPEFREEIYNRCV